MKNVYPALGFSLSTLADFESEGLARAVVRRLVETISALTPATFDDYEPVKRPVNGGAVGEAVDMWLNRAGPVVSGPRSGSVLFENREGVRYQVGWRKADSPGFAFIGGEIPLTVASRDTVLEAFLHLVRDLAVVVDAAYGEVRNMSFKDWDRPLDLFRRLPDVPWSSIYGEPYLELFGTERIRSAPFFKTEPIAPRHVWAQASDSPFEQVPEPTRAAIRNHLGEDAFMSGGRWRYDTGRAPAFDVSRVVLRKGE